MATFVCSLCQHESEGFGHNPEPLKAYQQRCCDLCNATRVIPARLARLSAGLPPKAARIVKRVYRA